MSSLTSLLGHHETEMPLKRQIASPALGPRFRLNGYLVIAAASTALALATASECHSVFYPPSLLYGAVLWAWWGCVGSLFWKLGQQPPLILRFSPGAIAFHLLAACAIGVAHLLLLGSLGFTGAGWRAHSTAIAILTSHVYERG